MDIKDQNGPKCYRKNVKLTFIFYMWLLQYSQIIITIKTCLLFTPPIRNFSKAVMFSVVYFTKKKLDVKDVERALLRSF